MDPIHIFRRQFILSTNSYHRFENWTNLKITYQNFLSVHPDLEISQSSLGHIQITLLGFAINPFEPDKSNQEILDELITGASDFYDIIRKSEHLGGRWVMIFNANNNLSLFHDPGGQRQIYYYKKDGQTIAGSDPAIIHHFVRLEKDTNPTLIEFINSSNFIKTQNSWIGDGTIFKDVKHLLPNHYLKFDQSKSIRFWPYKPITEIDLDTATILSSRILEGSLKAINNRQKLALAVTGGWDSRVLLSASKDIHNDICYFISVGENENIKSTDIEISSTLFEKLNIPFYIQKCGTELEESFKKIYENNIFMARSNLTKTNYIYQYHLEFNEFISISGGLGEIARTCIRPQIPIKINGANLVKLYCIDYDYLIYPITELDAWIDDTLHICQKFSINLYDMLYWEQRIGNWGAMYPAEEDIAIDQFCPFNNRLLLSTMLSVEEKYRRYPDYILFYNIIKKMWPEILAVPIGVCDFKLNTRNKIKYLIRRMTGVY